MLSYNDSPDSRLCDGCLICFLIRLIHRFETLSCEMGVQLYLAEPDLELDCLAEMMSLAT